MSTDRQTRAYVVGFLHGADGRLVVEMRILPPPTGKDSSGWF